MMLYDTTPQQLASVRRTTNESHSKMPGVNYIPALDRCCDCGKRRTAATGKYLKRGFVCGMCGRDK